MDEPKHEEVQELMEEVAKELGYEWDSKEQSRLDPLSQRRQKRAWAPFIIGAIIVFCLIIQWAAISRTNEQFKKLATRLTALEERITALQSKSGTSSQIATKIKRLDRQVGGLETSLTALSKRVDKLSELAKRTKLGFSSPKQRVGSIKVYIVRKGDSLFRIAKKYGVSIASIRRANGLGTKAVLHPGQRLVIPPK